MKIIIKKRSVKYGFLPHPELGDEYFIAEHYIKPDHSLVGFGLTRKQAIEDLQSLIKNQDLQP